MTDYLRLANKIVFVFIFLKEEQNLGASQLGTDPGMSTCGQAEIRTRNEGIR
jgi:hypothetical protein